MEISAERLEALWRRPPLFLWQRLLRGESLPTGRLPVLHLFFHLPALLSSLLHAWEGLLLLGWPALEGQIWCCAEKQRRRREANMREKAYICSLQREMSAILSGLFLCQREEALPHLLLLSLQSLLLPSSCLISGGCTIRLCLRLPFSERRRREAWKALRALFISEAVRHVAPVNNWREKREREGRRFLYNISCVAERHWKWKLFSVWGSILPLSLWKLTAPAMYLSLSQKEKVSAYLKCLEEVCVMPLTHYLDAGGHYHQERKWRNAVGLLVRCLPLCSCGRLHSASSGEEEEAAACVLPPEREEACGEKACLH